MAILGDGDYYDFEHWVQRKDLSFENIGMHYAQYVLKLPIKNPLTVHGNKMIFGPAGGDNEGNKPLMSRQDFEAVLSILESNGPDLEEKPSFLEGAVLQASNKRNRTSLDDNSEQRVMPQTVTHGQTQPTPRVNLVSPSERPSRSRPGLSPTGSVYRRPGFSDSRPRSLSREPEDVTKKTDNSLLYVGIAALAGYFLVS